jgi:hypothetical protein
LRDGTFWATLKVDLLLKYTNGQIKGRKISLLFFKNFAVYTDESENNDKIAKYSLSSNLQPCFYLTNFGLNSND